MLLQKTMKHTSVFYHIVASPPETALFNSYAIITGFFMSTFPFPWDILEINLVLLWVFKKDVINHTSIVDEFYSHTIYQGKRKFGPWCFEFWRAEASTISIIVKLNFLFATFSL